MNNKLVLTGLLIVNISGCTAPKYLPGAAEIDVNQYGSYIMINRKTGANVNGELIATDSSRLIVLAESDSGYSKKTVIVPLNEVNRFTLRYAQSKHYGWTIPVYTLATISHGIALIITAPVNLIVTISVTASGENAFKYSDKEMTSDKLKMFARFPQGIPPNIRIAMIK